MLVWLEPAAVAAATGTVVAAGLAVGWQVAGEGDETARWRRRAAGSGLVTAALLALRLIPGGGPPAVAVPAPPAATYGQAAAVPAPAAAMPGAAAGGAGSAPAAVAPRDLDPAAAADTRAFLRTRYRPVLEELGPLLDRYLAEPAQLPPAGTPAAAEQAAAVAADRATLGALKADLAALSAPRPAAALVEITDAVVSGLMLVAEQEQLALTGRSRPPAERAARRRWLSETYVEPWLAELLTLTAASGAAGSGDM